jgi:hypothetical protein
MPKLEGMTENAMIRCIAEYHCYALPREASSTNAHALGKFVGACVFRREMLCPPVAGTPPARGSLGKGGGTKGVGREGG